MCMDSYNTYITGKAVCSICTLYYYKNICIPYGGKLWRVETLADLANDHKFAKVSSAKILCSSTKYIIKVQIRQSLFRQLCFCSEFAKVCTHQSFPPYGTLCTKTLVAYMHKSSYIWFTYCDHSSQQEFIDVQSSCMGNIEDQW